MTCIQQATDGLDSLKPRGASGDAPAKTAPAAKASRASKASKQPPATDKPMFAETVEYAQKMLSSSGGKGLSVDMEARLIKFLILHRRKEYQVKKEARHKVTNNSSVHLQLVSGRSR